MRLAYKSGLLTVASSSSSSSSGSGSIGGLALAGTPTALGGRAAAASNALPPFLNLSYGYLPLVRVLYRLWCAANCTCHMHLPVC
jgi:hypothetical protein